jgi:RecG-like helicase
LTKERDSVLPKLKAAFDEKEEAYRTAKTAFETSENELRQAKIFLSNKSNFFEHSIGKQKDILIESADSQIDSAIEFFQKKLEWLRSPERLSHGKAGAKRNVFSMEKTVKQESNLPAVNRALQYCQKSIQELEAMKLIPSIDTGKIEEMKKAIPDISIFEIFEGSKPLEKSGNPLDSLLSDSHLDYVKGKVLEKVERTLNPKKKASARR